MDTNDYLRLAAYNNAAWCDSLCRSHGIAGEFHDGFWLNFHQVPPYYPDLVTLLPTARPDSFMTFLTTKRACDLSVKDSFATLDLTGYGFQQLFQAQWIFRPATTGVIDTTTTRLQWQQIQTEETLLAWEKAWGESDLSIKRIFLPALLQDTTICILAGYQAKQIVAGAIANRTNGVIGLSNIFTPEQGQEYYWKELLEQVARRYPGLSMVGYERDESLTIALHTGFTASGPLRVWIKKADPLAKEANSLTY